jgi:hypothetical protein
MPGDVATRPILWTGIAIATTVAVVVGAVFLLLAWWDAAPDIDRVRMPYAVEVSGPALESAPQLDLARYRAEKQRILDSAAWLDAQRGIARIPVADAMAWLAASAASAPRAPEGRP